jgi:glyoxylase-like metal-dependent hydrolase (beta-lactamase superfamily II)
LPLGQSQQIEIFHDQNELRISDPSAEFPKIQNEIQLIDRKIKIILSHSHQDQIMTLLDLINFYGSLPIYIGKDGVDLFSSENKRFKEFKNAIKLISTGNHISIGKIILEVISTPGHTHWKYMFD